ncbi:uncharacterized protein WCC33_018550 [Rhinophrynus dorsalis]
MTHPGSGETDTHTCFTLHSRFHNNKSIHHFIAGQHSPRDTDRLRPLTNHGIPIYPIKRKLSPDPPQLPKRACPTSHPYRRNITPSPVNLKSAVRPQPLRESTPKVLDPHFTLEHVLKRLMPERKYPERREAQENQEDQPLALVKRTEVVREQPPLSPALLQQMRPSVITCVSKQKPALPPSPTTANPLRDCKSQDSPKICSSDVDEHFQRSLASSYKRPNTCCTSPATCPTSQSACIAVEDHFSKALGSKWLLIRAAADSPSSDNRSTRPL